MDIDKTEALVGLWYCDPSLNVACDKESCGTYCRLTRHEAFALRDMDGLPISASRIAPKDNLPSRAAT